MAKINIYTKKNIQDLNWQEINLPAEEKTFLLSLIQLNTWEWIVNLNCEFCLLKVDNTIFPFTISQNNYNDSYVSSIYTHYINYALEEINLINNIFLNKLCKILIQSLAHIFKFTQINKCIYINNFNLSTNLYFNCPEKYTSQITEYFTKHYPQHALIFRSLNKITNKHLLEYLQKNNYNKLLSRQIYLTDTNIINPLNKKDCKNDLKLLAQDDYMITSDSQIIAKYIPQIIELYNNLYIKKYSKYNPQFTEKFIETTLKSNFFEFYLFQNKASKQIDAVLGFYTNGQIITAPIVGYNPNLNLSAGLYRRLVILLIKICTERKKILHWSSGVGKFKASRGGERHLEFMAVYYKHLNLKQKIGWLILKTIIKPLEYFFSKYDF